MRSLLLLLLLSFQAMSEPGFTIRDAPFVGQFRKTSSSGSSWGSTASANLVAWWQCNGDVLDHTANGYNLTLRNGPSYISSVPSVLSGDITQSLDLVGSSTQYAQAATGITQIGGASQASIIGWIYFPSGSSSIAQMGCSFQNYQFQVTAGGGNILFEIGDGSALNYGYCATPSAGWHNIAAIFNGGLSGNALRAVLYIDGTAQTLTFSGTIPATLQSAANMSTWLIGYDYFGDLFTTGYECDQRVFNTALTALQVSAIVAGN